MGAIWQLGLNLGRRSAVISQNRLPVLSTTLLVLTMVLATAAKSGPFMPTPTFIRAWGSTGGGDGQFRGVAGIAADVSGNLYVCDGQNQRIQKFDTAGTFLGKWNSCPQPPCENAPDVTVDLGGNVFVLQARGHLVHKFTSSGIYIMSWDAALGVAFRVPRAIASDASGKVYVGDFYRVIVFTGNGVLIGQWPTVTSAISSIAIGPNGTVYVLEPSVEEVQAYEADGTFIRRWGSSGTGDGQFQGPQGIAVRADGSVFVADTGNDRIQVFTAEGVFVSKWGVSGTEPGQFKSPTDVAFVGESIFVTDLFSRVQEFATSPVPAIGTSWGKIKASYR
jgi:DNA-binding beta-propeller fold protein YncE